MEMIPKFKIGDIVRLLSWDVFADHISIPRSYWNILSIQDLMIAAPPQI